VSSPARTLAPHPHPIYTEGKKMGQEITELSAYIYAATYRQLALIGKFDEKGFWKLNGICSCAHWLNFQCGIGMNAAREKVRVANALKDLPKVYLFLCPLAEFPMWYRYECCQGKGPGGECS